MIGVERDVSLSEHRKNIRHSIDQFAEEARLIPSKLRDDPRKYGIEVSKRFWRHPILTNSPRETVIGIEPSAVEMFNAPDCLRVILPDIVDRQDELQVLLVTEVLRKEKLRQNKSSFALVLRSKQARTDKIALGIPSDSRKRLLVIRSGDVSMPVRWREYETMTPRDTIMMEILVAGGRWIEDSVYRRVNGIGRDQFIGSNVDFGLLRKLRSA